MSVLNTPSTKLQTNPAFLWNHRCHQVWANETLYFWRFGFSPRYNGPEILARIKSVMCNNAVLSFAIYELTGERDILIRLWMPPSVTRADFDAELRGRLEEVDLQTCDPFVVSSIISHWVWDNNGTEAMRVPPTAILKNRLSDGDIRRINEGQITPEEFRWFADKNIIAPFQPAPGVKFLITIPAAAGLTVYARDNLQRQLRSILLRARSVSEVSIYCGSGFAEFLLMAKVDPARLLTLNSELIQPINEIGIGEVFGVRTFTHIVIGAPSDARTFQDRLPLKDAVILELDERQLEEYLHRPEEEKLEFKGSAFADMKRWLNEGQELHQRDAIAKEGVLRAVVGQLNSKGGKVIVGVLEAKKFQNPQVAERLNAFPHSGEYVICGVNVDYKGNQGWDEFALRLQDLIATQVVPSPRIWITLRREEYKDKDVCIISVRPPVSDWFYLKDDPSFYVRHGNTTRQLLGPEADGYKRLNPR